MPHPFSCRALPNAFAHKTGPFNIIVPGSLSGVLDLLMIAIDVKHLLSFSRYSLFSSVEFTSRYHLSALSH